ncbi:MAG: hypothetical protein QM756_24220 [Polyangiaceae bacterium]
MRVPTASTTGGLLEGLEAHDRKVGLSPSGRVRSALLQAAHSEQAPQLGVAHFRVTVLQDGSVEVTLKSFSDGREGWESVAKLAAEHLRKKPPRIPEPRQGTHVDIEIKAESVYPNGGKFADMHGPRLEAAAPEFKSRKESEKEATEQNPVAGAAPIFEGMPQIKQLPGVYVAGKGKICSYRLGITPLGPVLTGGCDPSNIGAKPMRMVHSRVEDETLF